MQIYSYPANLTFSESISTLRLAVKDAHQELARELNKDFNVIQEAIDFKPIQLECKGKVKTNVVVSFLNRAVKFFLF